MFNWIKKINKWIVKAYDPVIKKETVSLKDLKKKTKIQLESIGRRMGIELDRRMSKLKLVNRIKFRARLKRKK